jgi:AbrB family looped-hinge helix DNA binding protein
MSDTYMAKVGPKGRVVIPSAARRALGIEEGDELAVVVEDDGVRFVDRTRLVGQIQEGFGHVDHSLSEELIAERRFEARREFE